VVVEYSKNDPRTDRTEPILNGNTKHLAKIHHFELSVGNLKVKPSHGT